MLKSVIIHRKGSIRDKGAKETIGLEKCLRLGLSHDKIKCLTNEDVITVQLVNALRDAAQHYLVEISENQLYLYTQAGVTL